MLRAVGYRFSICCPTPNLFGVEHDQRREEGEEKRWAGQNREKPAQKVMKKIGQRIKQEQKGKSMGRSSLINFLKRKVLPMTVKREETGSRKERISYKKRRAKEEKEKEFQRKEIGRQSNRRRMKEAREMKSPRVWEMSGS